MNPNTGKAHQVKAPEVVKPSPAQIAARERAGGKEPKVNQVAPVSDSPLPANALSPAAGPQASSPNKIKQPEQNQTKTPAQQKTKDNLDPPPQKETKRPSRMAFVFIGIAICLVIIFILDGASTSHNISANAKAQTVTGSDTARAKDNRKPVSQYDGNNINSPNHNQEITRPNDSTFRQANGIIEIRASTKSASGQTFLMASNVKASLFRYGVETNSISGRLPIVFANISDGTYGVTINAQGFEPPPDKSVYVASASRVGVDFNLEPAKVSAIFTSPDATNVTFSIYNYSGKLLGDSKQVFQLKSFTDYYLTFGASNWRHKREIINVPFSPEVVTVPISMVRVKSAIRIELVAIKGDIPKSGTLQVDNGPLAAVKFPYENSALPLAGEFTLKLTIDGYDVTDTPRTIQLVDMKRTLVVFKVSKRSWYSP